MTDAILTKYAEQYGLNKEYLSKNRHLISYFAQLEEQAKNAKPYSSLTSRIKKSKDATIIPVTHAKSLSDLMPKAVFTENGQLDTSATFKNVLKKMLEVATNKNYLAELLMSESVGVVHKNGQVDLGLTAGHLFETSVYNFTQATGIHNGIRGASGHDWYTGETLTASEQAASLGWFIGEILTAKVGSAVFKGIKSSLANKVDDVVPDVLRTDIGDVGAMTTEVSGIVTSRINIAKGPTRVSPSKNAGFNHVVDRHFNPAKNAGQFTISQSELIDILSDTNTIKSPVHYDHISGNYYRKVDLGYTIGTNKPSLKDVGGLPTSKIMIYTDRLGNLITAYPTP